MYLANKNNNNNKLMLMSNADKEIYMCSFDTSKKILYEFDLHKLIKLKNYIIFIQII
jgi:hypothetical protein